MSAGNNNENDEDSDEDNENTQDDEKEKNFDEDDEDNDDAGQQIKKVDAKGPDELNSDFADNNYWDIGAQNDAIDVDSLIAELDD